MSDFDLDRELRQALRDSSETASPGFARGVLARLEDGRRTTSWLPGPAFAAAAVLLLVVGAVAGLYFTLQDSPPELTTSVEQRPRREELLREYRALERELDQLRQLASEQTPVLYLGGDEGVDLMYDLASGEHEVATLVGKYDWE